MDRDRLSLYWLKKSPLVYSQAEGQGPLRQAMILITKARKNKSKKQFLMESELASSLQQFPTVEVHSTTAWEKRCNDHSGLVRWIFLGVYAIFASVTKVETCLPFVPLLEPDILQGIFLSQGSNSGLLHCRQILYLLSHEGSPNLEY